MRWAIVRGILLYKKRIQALFWWLFCFRPYIKIKFPYKQRIWAFLWWQDNKWLIVLRIFLVHSCYGNQKIDQFLSPGCVSDFKKHEGMWNHWILENLIESDSRTFKKLPPKHKLNFRRMFTKQSWTTGEQKPCRRQQIWKALLTKGKEVVTRAKEEGGDNVWVQPHSVQVNLNLGFVYSPFLFGEVWIEIHPPRARYEALIYGHMHRLCPPTASCVHTTTTKKWF